MFNKIGWSAVFLMLTDLPASAESALLHVTAVRDWTVTVHRFPSMVPVMT